MLAEAHRDAIEGWVDDHRTDCIDFLRDLISIPSASTVGEDEEAVVERIQAEMESLGYDRVFVDGIGNVHGVVEGESDGVALFNSHVDTVGPGDTEQWPHDPYDAEIDDGTLYGLGASDMKSAMAAMVYGGAALIDLDLRPSHTLYVTGVVMEEVHEGHAMRFVDQELGVDLEAVVLGEASEMNVKRGHRGRCECKIDVRGKSCHGSAPERGVNPIYRLSPIIDRIAELTEETATDDFLGRGTVAPTNVKVNTPSNCAVPAGASIYFDRRITLGEDESTVLDELRDAIAAAEAEFDGAVDATPEILTFEDESYTGYRRPSKKYYPAWVLDEDHELVDATARVASDLLDRDVEVTKWTFSTDGNYTMGVAGIPTVGFGPSEERYAHTPDDQVEVENVLRAAAVYAGLGLAI